MLVFLFANYRSVDAFRLNDPEYSAFHYEEEVLLVEDIPLDVIAVEDNMVIHNDIERLEEEYNDRTVNVIYLYRG